MSRHDLNQSALLVVDVQNEVVATAPNRGELISNIVTLVDRARSEKIPVVWVQHSDRGLVRDSVEWQLVDELSPAEGEPIVHKHYGDSFVETDLGEQLERLGVDHLVVAGAQTDACIRSTLHGALARGFDTTLVGDAHGTEDMQEWGSPMTPEQAIEYTNFYWAFSRTHEAQGSVVSTADVEFRQ